MRQFRYLMIFSALMAVVPSAIPAAHAQESIPALQLDTQSLRSGGGGFVQEERPTFNYQNPYLNDTLILQYQNILLERMVLRQSALARTEKSFMDVGVPFDVPPPPRGICEQLPVNVPCYKAYPDLFPGAVPEIEQIDQSMAGLGQPSGWDSVAAAEPPPPPETDLSAYRWAEITCAGGKCAAVVAKDSARRTVREGDTLDDGIRVTKVTATGVEVSKDGKTEALTAAPAPSRGGAASPKYAGNTGSPSTSGRAPELTGDLGQRAQQLEDHFSKDGSGTPEIGTLPVATSASVARSTEEMTRPAVSSARDSAPADHGPPLGPTGLF